jgi:hypothetical protein
MPDNPDFLLEYRKFRESLYQTDLRLIIIINIAMSLIGVVTSFEVLLEGHLQQRLRFIIIFTLLHSIVYLISLRIPKAVVLLSPIGTTLHALLRIHTIMNGLSTSAQDFRNYEAATMYFISIVILFCNQPLQFMLVMAPCFAIPTAFADAYAEYKLQKIELAMEAVDEEVEFSTFVKL